MSQVNVDTSYSPLQKILHWGVLALCITQFITGPKITESNLAQHGLGHSAWVGLAHKGHAVIGIGIFLLILLRLFLRWRGGSKTAATNNTLPWQKIIARINHAALYALLLILPITGYAAMYVWRSAGSIHTFLINVSLILVALHVIAALWHQFIMKDNLLMKMLKIKIS